MNVIYSSSDLYSELAAISIVSLLVNNSDVDDINIYIIDKGISEEHKRILREMVESYGRNLFYLENIDIEKIASRKISVGRWHISTFSRLFMLQVLPKNIHKVIYIDCDMIIRYSLKSLWKMDMEGTWVMSADDCRGKKYRENIGIPLDSIYTNNGLMVIDLDAWRANDVETKFIKFIKKYDGDITYVDQGVVNGVFQPLKKVKLLPIAYNAQTACYDLGYEGLNACRKPVWAYSKDQFEKDIEDPIIVHFTTCFLSNTRPWLKKDNHPYREEFLRYRGMTAWKNEPLWNDTTPIMKKVMTASCKVMPKPLTFVIICIFHAWVYPFIRNVKNHVNNNHERLVLPIKSGELSNENFND